MSNTARRRANVEPQREPEEVVPVFVPVPVSVETSFFFLNKKNGKKKISKVSTNDIFHVSLKNQIQALK